MDENNRRFFKGDNPPATLGEAQAVVVKTVAPAEAGVQSRSLDSGFRRCDGDSLRGKI
ncbi:MAG: hypothetical protein O2909_00280 [Chloroflexi bacterium]|nr:hypothetical protein [Chloroflexota bacterium]